MNLKIFGLFFIIQFFCVGINLQAQLYSEQQRRSVLQVTGVAAGYLSACAIDNCIENFIAPQKTLERLLARLAAEVGIGVATYYLAKHLRVIHSKGYKAYYHPDYDRATTAFHLGFNIREIQRALFAYIGKISKQNGALLTLDSMYGILHATALYKNLKVL